MRLPIGSFSFEISDNDSLVVPFLMSYLWYNMRRWATRASLDNPVFGQRMESLSFFVENPYTLRIGNDTNNMEYSFGNLTEGDFISMLSDVELDPLMGNLTNQEIVSFSKDKTMQDKVVSIINKFHLSDKQFWPVSESLILERRFLNFSSQNGVSSEYPLSNLIRLEHRNKGSRFLSYWWIDPDKGIFDQGDPSLVSLDLSVSCDVIFEPYIDKVMKFASNNVAGLNIYKTGPPLYLMYKKGLFGRLNPLALQTDNWIRLNDYLNYLGYDETSHKSTFHSFLVDKYNFITGNYTGKSGFFDRLLVKIPFIGKDEIYTKELESI